ncbi:hypothetical protein A6U86_22315 [Rhizobium sp. AC27/96]|uniref:hypothetical protein n=1 Tax=Rhizobium sp. AC27/96 TaxID=1841653 RepID=UPI00082846FF|nr:hypothetical protein [Rhizobium sp. AC27/96]OCJ11216.1 hypothetical protein A6U86_22315 [Rhizobium sp. AC27/96]
MRHPHPSRTIMFDTLFENRVHALANNHRETLLNSDLRNTDKQQEIIKNWASSKEFAGMRDDERLERFETLVGLQPLATDVMVHGDRLFDISNLVKQFQSASLAGLTFQNERLPYETIFISFGEQKNLTVDSAEGIFFEGAYVHEVSEHGEVVFDVILVCNDPKFVDEDENAGDLLKGLTRFYHIKIPLGKPLLEATNTFSYGLDPSVLGDRSAATAGTRLVAHTILYLSQPNIEATLGHDANAPKKMAQRSMLGEYGVQLDLDWRGYPSITYLGRQPKSTFELNVAPRLPVYGM